MKRSRGSESITSRSKGRAKSQVQDDIHPNSSGMTNHFLPLIKYTSPVTANFNNGYRAATTLPLNLIALIISFLDDIGDLARMTRTSRLLHYMTLPQLYERVHLHSYGEIRYINGRPEGFGSGSPFMMALNGLATNGHAGLVSSFRVWGQWKETGIEDFAKGRVPDNTMMLNIILRAAIDKMTRLASFCWELDCKPLRTLYLGLAGRDTLTSLTLKFPSARVPRPSVLIPPMANLKAFRAIDIDPMCYPDDISLLLLHSRNLRDLRLHFSPRMRQEAEATLSMSTIFGRCQQANYKVPVKHFGLENFFGPNALDGGLEQVIDDSTCETVTLLDFWGGTDPRTIFIDHTWRMLPERAPPGFKRVRINEVSQFQIEAIARASQCMEEIYLVNAKRSRTGYTPLSTAGSSSTPATLTTPSSDTPSTPADPELEAVAIRKDYLGAITQFHGQTLRILLLRDIWALDKEDVADLVRLCPNLEQLGLAVKDADHQILKIFMPFLGKLKALRVLANEPLIEHMRIVSHEDRMREMGRGLAKPPLPKVQVIGFGDVIYKIGKVIETRMPDGTLDVRREMTFADPSEAQAWEIWRMDCLDLGVDPIAE